MFVITAIKSNRIFNEKCLDNTLSLSALSNLPLKISIQSPRENELFDFLSLFGAADYDQVFYERKTIN